MNVRRDPQTLTAAALLALLAGIAVVTARPAGIAPPAFASSEYAGNGYHAWFELLAREGVHVSRFVLRPVELDDRIDTLISAVPPTPQAAERSAADIGALASWVRSGGRLVYLGRDPKLESVEATLLDIPFALPEVGSRGALAGPSIEPGGALRGLGPDRMLLVEHPGRTVLADGNGDVAVRYSLGRGEIIAVADARPFTNDNIRAAANARFAYLLAAPRAAGGIVAFDDGVHGALIERPWYRALPLPVRVTLAIAGIALVLLLAGRALPSGAPVPPARPREPTSAEFVAALAALYERTAARAAAAELLAHDALTTAARAQGLADAAPAAAIAARISDPEQSDAIARLGRILAVPPQSDTDFILGAQLAYKVRKEWLHGRYGDRGRTAFAGRSRSRRRR